MDSITIRVQDETLAKIERGAEKREVSKSELIREWFQEREELQFERAQLQSEYEELQTECDRLQNEKRLILEDREEKTELVEYVEDELSYREAGLSTRMKWWLFGKQNQ